MTSEIVSTSIGWKLVVVQEIKIMRQQNAIALLRRGEQILVGLSAFDDSDASFSQWEQLALKRN